MHALNWPAALLWGFIATLLLTTLSSGSRGIGLTRMDIPFLLGTIFTGDRDRAQVIGFAVHMLNGWLFAILYALVFDSLGFASWWLGLVLSAGHTAFILTTFLPLLPYIHPRMVSDYVGPQPGRQIEPPGFLGSNFGLGTPLTALVAHLIYGLVLGAFYRPL